jgi:hypothetical protein
MVLGGATIAGLGCFQPWISEVQNVDALAPTLTRNIFSSADSAALPGADGKVITALALISVVLSLVMWVRPMQRVAALIALLLATVAATAVVGDYLDINASIETLRTVYFQIFQVGTGVYITGFGVALWAIGAAVGLLRAWPLK